MAKPLDPKIKDILVKYGEDAKALWDCHGTWVVYHAALERIAASANIVFDPPQVIENKGFEKIVAICVNGRINGKAEWSIGEAAPYNNKNAYPYAMAEKRAKDRVILKLIGLHGLAYSEEEADEFKTDASKVENPKPEKTSLKQTVLDSFKHVDSQTALDAWMAANTPTIKRLASADQDEIRTLCASAIEQFKQTEAA